MLEKLIFELYTWNLCHIAHICMVFLQYVYECAEICEDRFIEIIQLQLYIFSEYIETEILNKIT